MAISEIKQDYKSFFGEVNTMAQERPFVTIIYSLAITIIAGFIAPHSLFLATAVFAISLPFHLSVIKNFKIVYLHSEEKIKDVFRGNPREKSKILGRRLRQAINQVVGRSIGFIEGLFLNKNKDSII